MTLSDEELQANLERLVGTTQRVDLSDPARAVASTPQRRGIGRRTQFVGFASAAASVALALAVVGSIALRDDAPASQSPGPSSIATEGASTSTQPISPPVLPPAETWTDLVWEATDGSAFEFAGKTFVLDGVADGDGFMAIGYTINGDGKTSRIWRSPDGRVWDLVDGDWFTTVSFDQIIRFETGFIIVGRHEVSDADGSAGPTRSAVWWSEDGSTWVERTPTAAEGLVLGSAAAGPSGLLIAAHGERAYEYWLRSDAKFNWTRSASSWTDDVRIFGVTAGGQGWLTFGVTGAGGPETMRPEGTQGAIWTSADAVTWSPAIVDEPGGLIAKVQRSPNGYIALGGDVGLRCDGCLGAVGVEHEVVTWVTADGRTWQRTGKHELGPLLVGRDYYLVPGLIAANDSRILAFYSGEDGRLQTQQTVDGATWSEIINRKSGNGSLERFPDISGPIIVGMNGVVAFGEEPYDAETDFMSPLPRFASGLGSPRGVLPTFPPRPLPSVNDSACPNQQPCGP